MSSHRRSPLLRPSRTPTVVALVADARDRARLESAMPATARIVFVADTQALRAAVTAGDADVVVLEPRCPAGRITAAMVRQFRDGFPYLPVLAYCDPYTRGSGHIVDMARAGVSEVLLRGVDDVRLVLGRTIEHARRQCVVDQVYERLAPRLPEAARPIVACFLRHAASTTTVSDAASELGVHRKTLVNRMAAAHLPPPRVINSWCRLLVAAELLDAPGRSVNQVAVDLSFSSGTALRNMLKRYTDLTPSALRAKGSLATLDALFLRALLKDDAPVPVGA
ncbi:helix-turn-helix domain-containing protein [Gemmatirosa kalamazoonensis]|uniref:helix-turn-helix domain-containing protein n=1 Tax=Gemmatirosa kalamazoonensis TaxID=861299 RepID=UPI00046D6381|nr:helix-turn-helix domain-containing protein [Gemmatirosa kalamazoonensis]